MTDLRGFYSTLVQIHELFSDEHGEAVLEYVQAKASANLSNMVESCLFLFSEIDSLLDGYKSQTNIMNFAAWQRITWSFKETKVVKLR